MISSKTSRSPFTAPGDSASRLRLFCVTHDDGAVIRLPDWHRLVAPGVEVVPVALPGWRGRETRDVSVEQLAEALRDDLFAAVGTTPYVLFGHGLGSLVI